MPPVSRVGNHTWKFSKSGEAKESIGMDALQNSRGQFQFRSLSPAPDFCSKASLGERSLSFLAAPSGILIEDSANEIAAKADQCVDKNNRTDSKRLQAKNERVRSK